MLLAAKKKERNLHIRKLFVILQNWQFFSLEKCIFPSILSTKVA